MYCVCTIRTVLGNVNPQDGEGMTPLHCAAEFGRPRHILLLSEGIIIAFAELRSTMDQSIFNR